MCSIIFSLKLLLCCLFITLAEGTFPDNFQPNAEYYRLLADALVAPIRDINASKYV